VIVLRGVRIVRLKIRNLSCGTGKEGGTIAIFTMNRNGIHRFDRSVASLACDTRLYVSFVRKVHKVGKIVNLDPWNGLFVFPILGNLANQWALGCHFRMTSHAFVDAWDARRWRASCFGMTILAWNIVVARVNLVTKRNGLLRCRNLRIVGHEKIEEVSKAKADERE